MGIDECRTVLKVHFLRPLLLSGNALEKRIGSLVINEYTNDPDHSQKQLMPRPCCEDAVAVISGERVPVVSAVLRMASPVCEAMFRVGMAEARSNEISVNVASKNGFVAFYEALIPASGRQTQITRHNVTEVASLADFFQVDGLIAECATLLDNLPKPSRPKRKTDVSLSDLLMIMNKSHRTL